jgi:hypothetical protein
VSLRRAVGQAIPNHAVVVKVGVGFENRARAKGPFMEGPSSDQIDAGVGHRAMACEIGDRDDGAAGASWSKR